ncbi:AMP-binding protein [Sphingobacterium faecium]|uniref:AMP-binding protein n=1 Tax=Sphingobacterium faecium TaxID=34087 RepID=UPI00320B643C
MAVYSQQQGHLFRYFYDHVIRRPQELYLSSSGQTWTFQEADDVIFSIGRLVLTAAADDLTTVIINFNDQRKLLLSFWACVALELDIILVPQHRVSAPDLLARSGCQGSSITLSDDQEEHSHDVCIDIPSQGAQWSEMPTKMQQYSHIFFFTSGTTGQSKLIKTSYYQLINAIDTIRNTGIMPYTQSQLVLISIPLFHSYGISAVVEYTQGGSALFLPDAKDSISPIQLLFDQDVNTKITAIEGVPYFYKQLLLICNRIKIPHLQHLGFGGDAVPLELLKELHGKFEQVSFSIRYGVTEIPSIIALNYVNDIGNAQLTCIGQVLPIYDLYLADEAALVKQQHTKGELIVQCDVYPDHQLRVETHDVMEKIGNHYHFISRNLFIKYKGYKINPVQVETCLNEVSGIADAKVYLKNDHLTADLMIHAEFKGIQALKKELAQSLNSYLIPDHFVLVEQIERTKTGKIKR